MAEFCVAIANKTRASLFLLLCFVVFCLLFDLIRFITIFSENGVCKRII